MSSTNGEKNHRILVIDDNPAIHEDFRKILGRSQEVNAEFARAKISVFGIPTPSKPELSFEIDSAFQGQEGLIKVSQALAERRPYALAFVDVRMPPGWDGVETVVQILRVCPELQVVICSAYSDYSWHEIIARVGPSDNLLVLKKPFENLEVLQLAHALTRKWSLAHQARSRLAELDHIVHERTEALLLANQKLGQELCERTQVQAALRLSEERFAKAFHASPLAMMIQKLPQAEFVDVNESFLRMTGFRREEVIGRTTAELALWVDDEKQGDLPAQLRQQTSVRDHECRLRTRSGEEREALVFAELFSLDAEAHLLTIVQDISERLSLEGQLRQAQKMEAIGQLAAGVAHDFNNILTIIQGQISMLLDIQTFESDTEKTMRQVLAAGERAATLIRQLLAYSRKQVIQRKAVRLHSLLEQLSSMLRRLIGEHITLEVQCAADLPAVHADPGNLEQTILNLALNARDAMPQGGRLTIAVEAVEIDQARLDANPEARLGQFICLTTSDTGCGMDEATQAHVFEPFFTTKEPGKGTGMGLAMVYGIVKQHGGWIELASKVGQGTSFRIFLPICLSASTEWSHRSTALAPQARRGTETILVVEDEPVLRAYVQAALERYGYRTFPAQDGAEALAVWQQERDQIDLLLTDMVMPGGITGKELARQLTVDKPKLKTLYTSGYSLNALGENFKLNTTETFLQKPYQSQVLVQTVRNCLDSNCPSG